jgi:hypothetical protein
MPCGHVKGFFRVGCGLGAVGVVLLQSLQDYLVSVLTFFVRAIKVKGVVLTTNSALHIR